MTAPDKLAQWQAIVAAESKRAGNAILGLLHARQKYPELVAQIERPLAEATIELPTDDTIADEKGL